MQKFPNKLAQKLEDRRATNSFRSLDSSSTGVDFYSNDYLGFARCQDIASKTTSILNNYELRNGSSGSRLLSGNLPIFKEAESKIAAFHKATSALLYNSGYDANLGLFSTVPQKHDVILYDEYIHASIRDGLQMSHARSYKFLHNNLAALEVKLQKFATANTIVYVVSETVFSMDGDSPDLLKLVAMCEQYGAYIILDEAHSIGVFGQMGQGLVQNLNVEDKIFARIQTFGKAPGCHGAAILGSQELRDYLINFSRSFIYTTALPPHAVANIMAMYMQLESDQSNLQQLHSHIAYFQKEVKLYKLDSIFGSSSSPIQSCIIPGNERVKNASKYLQDDGFIVKPILSPTVPQGMERLRFCLHSYNTVEQISNVLENLSNFVQKSS